jgi:quinohemoprotein ethanol dehydrogenase
MILRFSVVPLALVLACVLQACTEEAAVVRQIDDAALADESNTEEWLAYGRTYSEQRFSPLTAINSSNVSDLKVDWYIDLADIVGPVSTPLVANGVMYFIGARNIVRAVSVKTGEILWRYDPKVAEVAGDKLRVAYLYGGRGVALWQDKVYLATLDGRLIALDADTGGEVWSVMTVDPDSALYITGAPKAFKGKVLIGNGGTEIGPTRGYVTAYDAETGEQAWRFYVVPGNPADGFESDAMAMAAQTWTGEWWKLGGGGNVWNGITYDPEFDALYIGTGNGAPWNQKVRSPGGGDNLFLSSIVALDPDTGRYRWHYQTTPGESWDYNSSMDIVLADLNIDGRDVKALLHAPKNGFFYVIDRATGKLISAEPFAEINWATKVDLDTGRPVEAPGVRYEDGSELVIPGAIGAHNWPPMSFNPNTGLVYIPTIHQGNVYFDDWVDHANWLPPDWKASAPTDGTAVGIALHAFEPDDPRGSLQAWDPIEQRRVWEVSLPISWNPGTLTTAGDLVFQGRADGEFVAYHAATGERLWSQHMGVGISAPPITYAVDGRQYVALLVGWGSAYALVGPEVAKLGWSYGAQTRRLVVFSLEGEAAIPAAEPPVVPVPIAAPDFVVDAALAARGQGAFVQCGYCHGAYGAVAGGLAPDLRASPMVWSEAVFLEAVRGGGLRARGMPAFESLTDTDANAIRHFIRQQAELGLAAEQAPSEAMGGKSR